MWTLLKFQVEISNPPPIRYFKRDEKEKNKQTKMFVNDQTDLCDKLESIPLSMMPIICWIHWIFISDMMISSTNCLFIKEVVRGRIN